MNSLLVYHFICNPTIVVRHSNEIMRFEIIWKPFPSLFRDRLSRLFFRNSKYLYLDWKCLPLAYNRVNSTKSPGRISIRKPRPTENFLDQFKIVIERAKWV